MATYLGPFARCSIIRLYLSPVFAIADRFTTAVISDSIGKVCTRRPSFFAEATERLMGITSKRTPARDVRQCPGAEKVRKVVGVGLTALMLAGPGSAAFGGEPWEAPPRTAAATQAAQPLPPPTPQPRVMPPADTLPQPQLVNPLGPEGFRLPLLSGAPGSAGGTPQPTPEVLKQFGEFIERRIDPQNNLDVIVNRSTVLVLKRPPRRIFIGPGERVATAELVLDPTGKVPPHEITIVGKEVGTAVLNIWFTDPRDPQKEVVLSYLVRVHPDPEERVRLDNTYKALSEEINHAFPDSFVIVHLVGDQLIVSGQAKDIVDATQILQTVARNAPLAREAARNPVNVATTTTDTNLTGTASQTTMGQINLGGGLPGNVQAPGRMNVVNLLRVPGEQQVMLKVDVAEVNRTAARSIGVDFNVLTKAGNSVFNNLTGTISLTTTAGGIGTGSIASGNSANLFANLDNGQIRTAIQALKNLNLARSLAEPNVTALNGREATFQSGGQFPVPIVTGFTAAGLQGVSFVPFGVSLRFTPYITDRDRIRLDVSADVSTKDLSSAPVVVGTTNVPNLNTRNFHTIVELRKGQTLAVAGLIQNNYSASATRVPFFGDLPVIGRLFASDNTQSGEQELVVLITPELVHPVDCHEAPPLPGSDVFEPGDIEFYLLGRLESRRAEDFRSQARTDLTRMLRYIHCEDIYIIGPKGHSDGQHP
jgi:pilus assembly protein CpaC